jgi:hypothetical protein
VAKKEKHMVVLPASHIDKDGRKWHLHMCLFNTPDGVRSLSINALSKEHVLLLLEDIKREGVAQILDMSEFFEA